MLGDYVIITAEWILRRPSSKSRSHDFLLLKNGKIPARRSTTENVRAKESSYPSPLLSYYIGLLLRLLLYRRKEERGWPPEDRPDPDDLRSRSIYSLELSLFSSLLMEKCFLRSLTLTLALRGGGKDGKIGRKRRVESN